MFRKKPKKQYKTVMFLEVQVDTPSSVLGDSGQYTLSHLSEALEGIGETIRDTPYWTGAKCLVGYKTVEV